MPAFEAPWAFAWLPGGILVLTIRAFGNGLGASLGAFLRSDPQAASAVLVDLRGNRGGALTAAADLTSFFVREGTEIIYRLRTKRRPGSLLTSRGRPVFPEASIVLLIDSATASAAEVFATAVRDNTSAVVLGGPSRGKPVFLSTRMVPAGHARGPERDLGTTDKGGGRGPYTP